MANGEGAFPGLFYFCNGLGKFAPIRFVQMLLRNKIKIF